jgi:RND family efflux transporter MFP subunit
VAVVLAALLSVAAYLLDVGSWFASAGGNETLVTATVKRASLPIEVSAGGELESADAVDVTCQLEGQEHKIIEMLPEGTQVREGETVIRLDPAEINEKLALQEIKVMQAEGLAKAAAEELKIQQNLGASQIAQAELALRLAELDKKKFLEGEYQADLSELQGSIALAQVELQNAQDQLEYGRDLVKKGFQTLEQLRSNEQEVKRAQFALSSQEKRLEVLENFTRERQEVELTAKAIEAERDLERAKSSAAAVVAKAQTDMDVAEATARLERAQLERIQQQLQHCQVTANANGTLVYAKDKNKRIEVGAVVHYKQKLFSVPKLSAMQVQAWVHESEVKKIGPGMPADIRVDAFPNLALTGRVKEVASFYDSTRHWLSGGVKEYATTIEIEENPQAALKPGMTSNVTIRVGELSDSLIVPLAAVTEKNERKYAFVVRDGKLEPCPVSIGGNTSNYVEILGGLSEGERVALDARRRAADLEVGGTEESAPEHAVQRAASL